MKLLAVAAMLASPTLANPIEGMWASENCLTVNEAMAFDADATDLPAAEYAEAMADMALAFGFLHGFAVANGWPEVEGFDYVAEFRTACELTPDIPPIRVLFTLF